MPAALALAGLQGIAGLAQGIFGGRKARKAERALENLQTPTTENNAAINNLYNQASASPYATASYQNQMQNINRGTTTALSALGGRRSALAGVSSVLRAQSDAMGRAGANAEQQQFGRLGAATQMKANDDNRVWEVNKYMPYQKQFSLLAQKAAGGNATANAGWQNLFGGMQTAAMGAGDKSWKQLFGGQ
jgi:hypothetical protein